MIPSLARMKAIIVKEFRQLSRDRITFGMVVMIPLIQLLLFGFAINTDIRNILWVWWIKAAAPLAAW